MSDHLTDEPLDEPSWRRALAAVGACLERFLTDLPISSRRAYLADLEQMSIWLGHVTIIRAMTTLLQAGSGSASHVLERFVRDHAHDGTMSPADRRRLSAVRSWLRYARAAGLIAWRVAAPRIPVPNIPPLRLDAQAVSRLLAAVPDGAPRRAARDRAMIHALGVLGLRTSEVATLTLADVHEQRRTISVRGQRGQADAEVSWPEPSWSVLAHWLVWRSHAPGPLFPRLPRGGQPDWHRPLDARSIRRLVAGWSARAGLYANPRCLRAAAVMRASNRPHAVRRVLRFARLWKLSAFRIGDVSTAADAQDVAADLAHAMTTIPHGEPP